ncbi:hypothetical protein QUB56_04910 [Microcoleus sp. AR_TQ3_B6]|uniref:hypothetical protein n=1 Tax=Microcoleus sp. AR_TQ3_B6 TaxID=3055284 RepID=UPI002FCE8879
MVVRASQSSHNLGVNTTNRLSANNSYAETSQEQSSIQILNETSTELLSENQWNVAFITMSIIEIFILFRNSALAVILAIAASIAYVKYQNSPIGKAAAAKRELEALQRAEEAKQERLRQEEQKRILIEEAQSQAKLLTTTLAHTALNEFKKVNARLRRGVNSMDFLGVITPAKFATQKFERSKDYNVCPYLSDLISKNMLYYEIAQECFQQKVAHKPLDSQFKAILQADFPELKGLFISFGSDLVLNKIWQKAYHYSAEIEKILESSDNLSD